MVTDVQDTAAGATDTATDNEQATPEETLTETALVEETETESAETTETVEDSEAEDEPSPLPGLLAALSEEELTQLPVFKDVLARRAESARVKSEADTASKIARERQDWAQTGKFADDLIAALSVEDGESTIDREAVTGVTERLIGVATRNAVQSVGTVIDAEVPSDFTMTREETQRSETASAAFIADPSRGGELIREWLSVVKRHAVESATPELRKQWEQERAKKDEAAATAAEREAADTTRAQQGGATRGVTGKTASSFDLSTKLSMSRSKANGWNPTADEWDEAWARTDAA